MKKLFHTLLLVSLNYYGYSQNNVVYGSGSGNAGTNNTSVGVTAGDVITGNENSFYGYAAGLKTTSSSNNTMIGSVSGYFNTTGARNTFIGKSSGYTNSSGNNNTYLGYYSGFSALSSNNTFIGYESGKNVSSGGGNTLLGSNAGVNLVNGSGNVFIGSSAGFYETSSNKLYIDNSSTSTPLIYGDFNLNRVGINVLPGNFTLNVGGTLNSTGRFTASSISINTQQSDASLTVNGNIHAKEVKVDLSVPAPDYVFEDSYKNLSLKEIEEYIKSNKHLPDVPSAKEIEKNGIDLGVMNMLLLKKIEELTLHVILLEKEVQKLKSK